MPSTTNHYDQSLLAAAPAATKTQLQEGYTTDLLQPARNQQYQQPVAQASDPELNAEPKAYPYAASRPPTPFWRTTKGVVIIVVAVIVVLGAIIGGAVGGTAGKKKNGGATEQIGNGINSILSQPVGANATATATESPATSGSPLESTLPNTGAGDPPPRGSQGDVPAPPPAPTRL